MAHADPFPKSILNKVASEVGPRLLVGPGAPSAEVKETFAVWMLGLDTTTKPDEPIEKLAEQTGRWHHQISIDDQAKAFARSMPLGPNAADWVVTQVTSDSPIAEAIDKATEWIDKNVKGDPLVRLLVVPAYYLHAFWLGAGKANQILIVHRPEQYTKLKYETLYTPKQFLELLAQEPYATGIPLASA